MAKDELAYFCTQSAKKPKTTRLACQAVLATLIGQNTNRLPHDFKEKPCSGAMYLKGITYFE